MKHPTEPVPPMRRAANAEGACKATSGNGGAETELDEAMLRQALASSASVFVAGGMAYPNRIVAWLNGHPELTAGREFFFAQPAGFSQPPLRAPGGGVRVGFLLPQMAALEEYEFLALQYRSAAAWLAHTGRFDLVLAAVGRRVGGAYSLGLGVDFLPAALAGGGRALVEVNPALGSAPGAPLVQSARVEVAAAGPSELPRLAVSSLEPSARTIGRHVAELVRDGDCLQLGVGAIPEAVLRSLQGHRDLGVHSGIVSDGVRSLVERGVVNGRYKTIDRGLVVAGFLLGSQELYDWAQTAADLRLRPVNYTHDARVLARLERLISVNSAVEVDLLGQVNAERVRGRQISGVGGSLDFMRAAARSPGGRSIVALPATAAEGNVSRIVERIPSEAVVTATRSDVDTVVTEFGIAELRGASVHERRQRLVAIAAPAFREALAGG